MEINKMKHTTLCLILVISLGILPTVSASSAYSPGLITSDSPLWSLDLKMEEFTESIMLTDDARVNLQLKHANERIGELQQTSEKERVIEEYARVLERIESAKELHYETSINVQNQLEAHRGVIPSDVMEPALMAQMEQVQTKIQEHSDTMIEEESAWWSEKVAEYNIISSPTPISDFKEYTTRLDEGVTVIDAVRSDDTLMQSYIVRNEDGVVTIQTGTTDNYVKKYTFSIDQLRKLEKGL